MMSASTPSGAPRSELSLRVMSALLMVGVALLTLWWGGWPFACLWIAAGSIAGWEWSRITMPRRAGSNHLLFGLCIGIGGMLVAAGWPLPGLLWVCGMLGSCLVLAAEDRAEQAIGVIYASAIAIAPIIVRAEPGLGITLIAWSFAVVWSTDIAAYFTGRALGGPKLWPAVSPKKTWSGALGGAAAGVLAGLVVSLVAQGAGVVWPFGIMATIIAAFISSSAGQLGDLFESALKRRHDVKDSGSIIPGHGGVLDRLDAFVVVVTIVAIAAAVWR